MKKGGAAPAQGFASGGGTSCEHGNYRPTIAHQDHFQPVKPLIMTNTCTVGIREVSRLGGGGQLHI